MADYDEMETVSLNDLEDQEEKDEHSDEDWSEGFDDMDAESWDHLYGDEEEEIDKDPWDLN